MTVDPRFIYITPKKTFPPLYASIAYTDGFTAGNACQISTESIQSALAVLKNKLRMNGENPLSLTVYYSYSVNESLGARVQLPCVFFANINSLDDTEIADSVYVCFTTVNPSFAKRLPPYFGHSRKKQREHSNITANKPCRNKVYLY